MSYANYLTEILGGYPYDIRGTKGQGYYLAETLGNGNTMTVYRAYNQDHGTVALKLTNKSSEFQREKQALKKLPPHPNIVTLIEAFDVSGHPEFDHAMVMTVYPKDMYDLTDRFVPFSSQIKWYRQMARAMAHCHENLVFHGDVKLENFVIDPEKDEVALCDFGFSIILSDPKQKTDQTSGTIYYRAPEVLKTNRIHFFEALPADVWSLGVSFWTFYHGMYPFYSTLTSEVHELIQYSSPKKFPGKESPAMEELMLRILNKNPNKRPDVFEIGRALCDIETNYINSL